MASPEEPSRLVSAEVLAMIEELQREREESMTRFYVRLFNAMTGEGQSAPSPEKLARGDGG